SWRTKLAGRAGHRSSHPADSLDPGRWNWLRTNRFVLPMDSGCPMKSAFTLLSCVWVAVFARTALAQEAQWIWSPEHPRMAAKEGDCYFRKTLQLGGVEEASITITADDRY